MGKLGFLALVWGSVLTACSDDAVVVSNDISLIINSGVFTQNSTKYFRLTLRGKDNRGIMGTDILLGMVVYENTVPVFTITTILHIGSPQGVQFAPSINGTVSQGKIRIPLTNANPHYSITRDVKVEISNTGITTSDSYQENPDAAALDIALITKTAGIVLVLDCSRSLGG